MTNAWFVEGGLVVWRADENLARVSFALMVDVCSEIISI